MATKHNDDFDLPDQHIEPDPPPPPVLPAVQEFKPEPVTVKPYNRTAWIREHGPKPPTAGMRATDFAIVGLFVGTMILIVKAWYWTFFS